MDRRTLLKLMAATSFAGVAAPAQASGLQVLVAGAGIVGASIAYHLAKAGAQVTIIDRQGPASHASRGTFAWINATWAKQPQSYHRLNQTSVSNWHSLQAELGLPVRWGGSLEWFDGEERQRGLRAQIQEQFEWGEPARMVSGDELAALEPMVDFDGAVDVAFSGNDGAVDPVAATRLMLAAAVRRGAKVSYPCELTGVIEKGGRLVGVETSLGPVGADRLVLATGADPAALPQFAGIDIPQRSRPGVIAVTRPMGRVLNRIIAGPGIHMHQRDDGRIVIGEQDGAPDNEAHALRLEGRPNDFPERWIAEEHAGRMLAVAAQFVPAMAGAEAEQVFIGWRPLPLDGHPVLGASPNRRDVYVAVMHSGVSLAPVVGQLATAELVRGEAVEQLAPFRPDRPFELVKRY